MDACVRWIESQLLQTAEELRSSRTPHRLWELPSRGSGRARLDCLAVSVFTRSSPWGGLGDGGAVTTNDPKVARFATLVRFNGEDRQTGEFHHHGYTALLDNVQAAVLDVKLRYLPKWIEHRGEIARLYREGLSGIKELRLPHFPGDEYFDSHQNYVIRTEQRDLLRLYLKEQGVETLVHWAKPMWEHKDLALENPRLLETESICKEVISLPMSAETTAQHVEITVSCIRDFFASRAATQRTAAAD